MTKCFPISSSSNASSVAHLTKSQWGNTHMYGNSVSSGISTTRTPGTGLQMTTRPAEVSCSSGYMADNSSARTPGIFLREKIVEEEEKVAEEKSFVTKAQISANISASSAHPKPFSKFNLVAQKKVSVALIPIVFKLFVLFTTDTTCYFLLWSTD